MQAEPPARVEETKQKLREINIGKKRKPVSEETRSKLRAKTLAHYATKKKARLSQAGLLVDI
jgi:hypothetical protein